MKGRPTQPMARPGARRSERWPEIVAGVALSVLFHGAVVATLVIGAWIGPLFGEEETEEPVELEFQDVELLALGEEPDPHALPRLTGDEGVPQEPEMVEPDPEVEPDEPPEEETEPDPEQLEREREERRRREREERRRRMDQALGEFEEEGRTGEAPEGHPDGVVGGTTTDPDAADMVQTYQARLLQTIERHWEIPTVITDSELQQLAGKVRVHVQLTADGRIEDWEFRQKSGDDRFDRSIERVLQVFDVDEGDEELPMPEHEDVRAEILRRGLILSHWEHVQR